MPSGKTLAKRPLNYNGVNIASPGPVTLGAVKPTGAGGQFSITDAIGAAQAGQNSANAANDARYKQGLGVLTQGYQGSQGLINQALQDTAYLGNKELQEVRNTEKQGYARTQQDAINKGLNNTTITGTMIGGVEKRAQEARTNIRDMVAKNRSAINLQGAANMNQGANSIAGFIGARNDNGPSLGEYANLVQGAAQANNGSTGKSTGTITKGSINDPIQLGSGGGNQIQQPGGGGALGTQVYATGAGAVGGGLGSMQIGSGGGGGGGSAGGGGSISGGGGLGGLISSALGLGGGSAGGSSGPSQVMTNAGYTPGSISMTPGQPGTGTPLPANPNAGNPGCVKWSYIFNNGQDPKDPRFCQ